MALSVYVEWLLRDMLRNHGTWTINASDYLGSLLGYGCITMSEKDTVEKDYETQKRNITLFYKILPPKDKDGLCAMVHLLKEGRKMLLADSLIDVAKQKAITINVDEWFKNVQSKYPDNKRGRDDDLLKKQSAILFDVKPAIKSFTGRQPQLHELHQSIQKHIQISGNNGKGEIMMVVVAGLGGVGKTQLVRRYVDDYAKEYDYNVVWIAAEKHENLLNSFYRLADELKISTHTIDDKKKDIRAVVKEVYKWFDNKTSLFVFDNAEQQNTDGNGQGIRDFLPVKSLCGKLPFVVITSRNENWNPKHFTVVRLLPLTDQEASEFIKNELEVKDDSQSEAVSDLAKTLQNLPLALQQAVSYIETTNKDMIVLSKRFTITNYLQMYEEVKKMLLQYKFPNNNDNFELKPTYFTWHITTDKFKKMGTITGTFALRLLNISAYCAPNKIPIQLLFLKLAENNEILLGGSVNLLKQYSMVTVDDTYMSVHRLVQDVSRLVGKEEGNETKVINDVCQVLHENFRTGDTSSELEIQKELQLHLEQAYRLIQKICDNPRDSAKNSLETYMRNKIRVEKECLIPLLQHLSVCYFDSLDPNQEIEICQRLLQYAIKYYGPDHVDVPRIMVNMGTSYGRLGNLQKWKEIIEKSLEIQVKHHGSGDVKVAKTRSNLAVLYGKLGDHKKETELLESALAVLENHYGCRHVEVAKRLSYLANAYGALGDIQKQKELLERGLAMKKTHYGSDHFLVAKTQVNLASVYWKLGDHNMQLQLLESALPALEKRYGCDHPEVAKTLNNLGTAYGDLGDIEKKKAVLERALAIKKKHYGSNHVQVASTLINLSNVYYKLRDYNKQKELLQRTLTILENDDGCHQFEVAHVLSNLAVAYGELGDNQKKKELLERALAIDVEHYGSDYFEAAV